MKKVDRTKARCYRDRAQSFIEGMRLLSLDLASYGNGVALLAVHAGISLADAILIACTGRRSNEQDHHSVLQPLRALCGSRNTDQEGLNHLAWIISQKTDFAYGNRRLDPDKEVTMATLRAERFVAWAYRCFPEIG